MHVNYVDPSLIVGFLVKIISELTSHSKYASTLVKGTARLVVEKGKILHAELAKEDMHEEDLLREFREKNITSVKNIRKAFLEADGELSIVLYNNKKH